MMVKISLLIPKKLDDELMMQMIREGYGYRNKSLWICEAIEQLLGIEKYPNIIHYEGLEGLEKRIVFSVPFNLKLKLEEAIVQVRNFYPTLEGVQSKIIRGAIMNRLICGVRIK